MRVIVVFSTILAFALICVLFPSCGQPEEGGKTIEEWRMIARTSASADAREQARISLSSISQKQGLHPFHRHAAAQAILLAFPGDELAVRALLADLTHIDSTVRKSAVLVLNHCGRNHSLRDHILLALQRVAAEDPVESVRHEANLAFRFIAGEPTPDGFIQ
jgi:hypothetical protein